MHHSFHFTPTKAPFTQSIKSYTRALPFSSGYGKKKCCCDKDRGFGGDLLPLLLLLGLAVAGGMITIMIGGRRRKRDVEGLFHADIIAGWDSFLSKWGVTTFL